MAAPIIIPSLRLGSQDTVVYTVAGRVMVTVNAFIFLHTHIYVYIYDIFNDN